MLILWQRCIYIYVVQMKLFKLNTLAFCAFLLLGMLSCKHRKQEVVAVQRNPGKHTDVKKTPVPASKTPAQQKPGSEMQQKLGINNKQVRENKLYSFIDDWYGVPYKYGGCHKVGVDCSCFTNMLYEKVYDVKLARSAADMFKACDPITIEQVKPGDLVFFKIGGKTISHVGVYLKGRLFVHASTSQGVIINSLDEAYYKKYFFSAGKMKHL